MKTNPGRKERRKDFHPESFQNIHPFGTGIAKGNSLVPSIAKEVQSKLRVKREKELEKMMEDKV